MKSFYLTTRHAILTDHQRLIRLMVSGVIQTILVSLNAWLISREKWALVFVVGCLISYVWTHNVKRVNASTEPERIAYALGAGIGCIAGLGVASLLKLTFFQR